ncbi:MAG: hypothetical protein M4579_000364 [Chaenotheca gracillima]|nr:MAG: hypothetical protein M4579_000364 [Chaenotheca gracillima]
MTSHPPGKCCYSGVKHEGAAKGEITKVGGISSYVTYPADKSTENTVLILPDVIGHEFINAQLIADQFAANGYFCLIPDLFNGDPVPLNKPGDFDIFKWLEAGHKPENVEPIITAVIKALRNEMGVKRIGGVGYCFGGKYVITNLRPGSGIDVGYTAHPSFVESDELRALKGPLSIAAAETDQIFPAPKRHETEEILEELKFPYQMTLYSGVQHGFAVRGDMSIQQVRFAKETAFLQALQWFDEYLKQ